MLLPVLNVTSVTSEVIIKVVLSTTYKQPIRNFNFKVIFFNSIYLFIFIAIRRILFYITTLQINARRQQCTVADIQAGYFLFLLVLWWWQLQQPLPGSQQPAVQLRHRHLPLQVHGVHITVLHLGAPGYFSVQLPAGQEVGEGV